MPQAPQRRDACDRLNETSYRERSHFIIGRAATRKPELRVASKDLYDTGCAGKRIAT